MTVHVQLAASGQAAVVSPVGDLDIGTCGGLRTALDEAVNGPSSTVVVDMDQVTFADSTCLAVLISTYQSLHAQQRRLMIVNARGMQLKVFRITGLDSLLDVRPPEEQLPEVLARLG